MSTAAPKDGAAKNAKKADGASKADSAGKTDGASSAERGPKRTPRLQERYQKDVASELQKELGYANPMQIPRLHKVVINIGMGEAIQNAKAMDAAVRDLAAITGQKPVITRAKKSVASFKLREGMAIGTMVTLRGPRMYDFLDKLMNVALPRLRDFQGVSSEAFDGRGNYTLGLREQLVFPEIDYDKIDKIRGMEITIVTTAKTDQEGRRLLQMLGMPFRTGKAPEPVGGATRRAHR